MIVVLERFYLRKYTGYFRIQIIRFFWFEQLWYRSPFSLNALYVDKNSLKLLHSNLSMVAEVQVRTVVTKKLAFTWFSTSLLARLIH